LQYSIPSGSLKRLLNNRGVTLVELLIAIVISSILILLFFEADVALRRSAYGWIRLAALEETALLVRQQLRNDLLQTDTLRQTADEHVLLINGNGVTIQYDLHNHRLKRNGEDILPQTVQLKSFTLTQLHSSLSSRLATGKGLPVPGSSLHLLLTQGGDRTCNVILPIRPWPERKFHRSAL
jgi:prepilin-type N-terminal cleavage/methylation domain-containing protein